MGGGQTPADLPIDEMFADDLYSETALEQLGGVLEATGIEKVRDVMRPGRRPDMPDGVSATVWDSG